MEATYGQIANGNGKKISYSDFSQEVKSNVRGMVTWTAKHDKKCKAKYKDGADVSDTASAIILL